MWFDSLQPDYKWSSLWYGYIRCGCGGIRGLEGKCPVCGTLLTDHEPIKYKTPDGREMIVNHTIYAGGEGGYEDYLYLEMIEREWKRPVTDADRIYRDDPSREPSPRAAIVVLFWSYFERRIERLLTATMQNLPAGVTEDLLNRYEFVGKRINQLYRILFETSYRADLNSLGFERVGQHLDRVRDQRNAFSHGDPHAIDDSLVESVVENLKAEHESWIAVFNKRIPRA